MLTWQQGHNDLPHLGARAGGQHHRSPFMATSPLTTCRAHQHPPHQALTPLQGSLPMEACPQHIPWWPPQQQCSFSLHSAGTMWRCPSHHCPSLPHSHLLPPAQLLSSCWLFSPTSFPKVSPAPEDNQLALRTGALWPPYDFDFVASRPSGRMEMDSPFLTCLFFSRPSH